MRSQSIQRESNSLFPPEEQRGDGHDGDEDGAKADHDVVAEIEEFNAVGPLILGKIVEAADVCIPMLIGEEAEHAGNDERIIQRAIGNIGLAEDGERRAVLRFEQSFHGG